MELIDSDFLINENSDDFIDRFVVNVTSPGQVRGSYPGIFGLATIDMTTEIVCEPEFTGLFCETTSEGATTTEGSTIINSTTTIMDSSNTSNISSTLILVLLFSSLSFLVSLFTAVVIMVAIIYCTRRNKKPANRFEEQVFIPNNFELTSNVAYHDMSSVHNYDYPSSTIIEEMHSNADTVGPHILPHQFDVCPAYNTISQSVESDGDPASRQNDIQAHSSMTYNYESPYWLPSNEEAELLSQFKELRMQSVSQQDLE